MPSRSATRYGPLARLEPEVRDLVAGLLDVDPEAFQLRLHYRLSGNTEKRLREYQDARQAMDAARQRYQQAQRSIVAELRPRTCHCATQPNFSGCSASEYSS